MGFGDFSVDLEKPLGIILEEREAGGIGGGVKVKEISADGSAAVGSNIVPGDILQQVNGQDVSSADFDSVMQSLIESPPKVSLTISDGLGIMDMPPNVLKTLQPEEAILVDTTVRQAVREIRRSKRLGELLKVEIIVGAGVKEVKGEGKRCMVRFFAIFSTDGVTTYSCNVSAAGIVQEDDERVKIVSLSCAKDEGLGQTIDLIQERR